MQFRAQKLLLVSDLFVDEGHGGALEDLHFREVIEQSGPLQLLAEQEGERVVDQRVVLLQHQVEQDARQIHFER